MSTMITREPTRNDIAHCQGPPQAAEGACCDLVRPRRGSAQRKVHEERFARRNTFRREFGLLLRCVARRSQIAGAKSSTVALALWAFPARKVLGGTSWVPLISQTGGSRGLINAFLGLILSTANPSQDYRKAGRLSSKVVLGARTRATNMATRK